jgi:glycosyltransferase involved in cell wall biosynthesis
MNATENSMGVHFKIIVPSYNCPRWIGRCLLSIENQRYKNYRVCVIDDASTEPLQRDIIEKICRKNDWSFHFNETNQGALFNIIHGIKLLQPDDRDVIITLDGDDWFFHNKVLNKLAEVYSSDEVYLTYGQFISYPRWNIGSCRPISTTVIEQQSYRDIPWVFSQPRTFRYFLWRHINPNDLLAQDGSLYQVSWDLAFMYPMLEMAGYRIRYIDEILYVYNKGNPLNDHKMRLEQQRAMADYIRTKPRYKALFNDKATIDTSTAVSKLKNLLIKIIWKIRRNLGLFSDKP